VTGSFSFRHLAPAREPADPNNYGTRGPLTPAGTLDDQAYHSLFAGSLFAGTGLQLVVVWILLAMIRGRLRRPVVVPALTEEGGNPLAAQT
jgi:hypothetical protein